MQRKSIVESLKQEQIVAPCIFDNISARAVELTGYKALILTGEGIAYSMVGVPNSSMVNIEEIIWLTNRMTDYTPLPVIVDINDGYGTTPSQIYLNVMRLAKSGAMAVIVDDSVVVNAEEASPNGEQACGIIERDHYLSKIKAAVKACENTSCIVIARSNAMGWAGINAAIERCTEARRLGAGITMINGAYNEEHARLINASDPGLKMWPDIGVADGTPVIDKTTLDSMNFKLIALRYTEKAAMFGMLYYGKRTKEDGNTVFHDTHDFDGILAPGQDYHELFSFWKKWLPMEDEFNDLTDIMTIDHTIKDTVE